MKQIFLDTETTGLSAADGDRIVEIGCIELDNRRLTGRTLHHYVNPQRSSHPDAVRVHGITDEFLADKPPFASIAAEFLEFVKDAEEIALLRPFNVSMGMMLESVSQRLLRPGEALALCAHSGGWYESTPARLAELVGWLGARPAYALAYDDTAAAVAAVRGLLAA